MDQKVSFEIPERKWQDDPNDPMNLIYTITGNTIRYEMNLVDEIIRARLIALGWTPPGSLASAWEEGWQSGYDWATTGQSDDDEINPYLGVTDD